MNGDDVSSQTSSTGGGEQTQTPGGSGEPTEEELRAAMEEELKRVTVDDVLLQTVVSTINLAGRRAGLVPGAEGERDLEQLQTAIDAVTALLPVLERRHREQLAPIRDAVSRLQMAYAQLRGSAGAAAGEPGGGPPSGGPPSGGPPSGGPPSGDPARPSSAPSGDQPPPAGQDEPGPAQRSGRLWVPGQ